MMITGNSADGWDAREVKGMYVSPDGNHWGSIPFTREQAEEEAEHQAIERLYRELSITIKTQGDLDREFKLINEKKSKLSCRLRKFIVTLQSS